MQEQPNQGRGWCECGCGNRTPLYTENRPSRGMVRGEPMRFIHGHRHRAPEVQWTVDASTGCWVWNGTHVTRGYGVRWVDGKLVPAHRFVYERERGPIPAGLQLDHLCRNRACVNPDHLEPVTSAVNTQRGAKAKITSATAMQVRLMRATTTLTHREIGDIVGLQTPTITKILAGQVWRMPKVTRTG